MSLQVLQESAMSIEAVMGTQLVKKSKHMMQKVFDDLAILRGVVTNVDGWGWLSCMYEIVEVLCLKHLKRKENVNVLQCMSCPEIT